MNDGYLGDFIEMCENAGVSDDKLIKIRTLDDPDISIDSTFTFAELKENFNRWKIY